MKNPTRNVVKLVLAMSLMFGAIRYYRSVAATKPTSPAGSVAATKPAGPAGYVWIKPGTFVMGSPTSESGRWDDEVQHSVTLTRGFWMSDHETTQAEYESVMGSNPSEFKGSTLPVEQVSWDDAVSYCKKLTLRELAAGRIEAGQAYRLPTEAEWEYAARAGTTGARHGELDAIGWYDRNSGRTSEVIFSEASSQPHPVQQKAANAWGLHDMMGNVWEWCSDSSSGSPLWSDELGERLSDYPTGSVTDPTGPS